MRKDSGGKGLAIVGGFGHLGNRIAAQLIERGMHVAVIDRDSSDTTRAWVEALGCKLVVGDIRDDAVLEAAWIRSAVCFIAVTDDACSNLEAAISARDMNGSVSAVLRMSDQSLAGRISSGFDLHALSAAALASPAFVSAATDNSVVASFTVDGHHIGVRRREGRCRTDSADTGVTILKNGSHLRTVGGNAADQSEECLFVELRKPGQTLRRKATGAQKRLRRAVSLLSPVHAVREVKAAWQSAASVSRSIFVTLFAVGMLSVILFSVLGRLSLIDALYFVVTTMTTVGYGDFNLQNAPVGLKLYGVLMMMAGAGLLATVYAIIADRVLTARVEHLLGRGGVDLEDHTVVVGLGSIGYTVAHDLRLLGVDVAGIDANSENDSLSSARLMFPVIIGDASKASILEKASIRTASTVIALTDDPIVNLNVALQARESNPKIKTILRTYQPDLAEKFRKLGLDEVLSTSAIAAPSFVDAALYPGAQGSFLCGDDDVLVVKHHVDANSGLLGKSVGEIGDELGIAVVLAARDHRAGYEAAATETALLEGMKVVALLAREKASILTG